MKTSQPEYHLKGLFGKVHDFFVIEVEDSVETPTSDALAVAAVVAAVVAALLLQRLV